MNPLLIHRKQTGGLRNKQVPPLKTSESTQQSWRSQEGLVDSTSNWPFGNPFSKKLNLKLNERGPKSDTRYDPAWQFMGLGKRKAEQMFINKS